MSSDSTNDSHAPRLFSWWVVVPVLLYVVLRLPILVHAPGGQDEHWFSVPGWTVWNEGVPRLPYVPTRERSTFFENSDKCMMALPPGLFYMQAPFHALFEPGYPTARMPLFCAALVAIVMTFMVARRLGATVLSSVIVASLMAIGRPLMFTGLMTRPDLLAALFGWISIWFLWRHAETSRFKPLAVSGLACGLAGLCHPFALLFAMQAGIAILFLRSSWLTKIKQWFVFGSTCAAALMMWAPLIMKFPYEFRSQFFSNVVERAGPGLPSRLLWPWPSIAHHARLLYEFAGAQQCGLLSVALVVSSIVIWKRRDRTTAVGMIALLWSSVFLTAVVAGLHPTKGYWVYPSLWILASFALTLDAVFASGCCPRGRAVRLAGVVVLSVALTLPGAGLRSTWIYLTNWGSPRYHGRNFIASVLQKLPEEGLFMADLSYVYDVYLSGRETLLCQKRSQYYPDRPIDPVAILLAWEGQDKGWASEYEARRVKRYGSRELPQTCFVDLYVPNGSGQPFEQESHSPTP